MIQNRLRICYTVLKKGNSRASYSTRKRDLNGRLVSVRLSGQFHPLFHTLTPAIEQKSCNPLRIFPGRREELMLNRNIVGLPQSEVEFCVWTCTAQYKPEVAKGIRQH